MIFQWATTLQEFCRQIFECFGLFTLFSTILHIMELELEYGNCTYMFIYKYILNTKNVHCTLKNHHNTKKEVLHKPNCFVICKR